MKKALRLLIAQLLIAALCLCGAAYADKDSPKLSKDVVILFTSDIHCAIDEGFGFAGVAAVRDQMAKSNHVILLDNGDAIQGEPIGMLSNGEAIIDIMNAVGYDAANIGNHEFDYGMEQFLSLSERASFPYINVNFCKEGKPLFEPYIMKEFDGVKIAIVGVSTPETIIKSYPMNFMDENGNFIYDFMQDESGKKLYDAVQKAVNDARDEGASYVLVLTHLGNLESAAPYNYASLLSNISGIDAMLDGHSHDWDNVVMKCKDGKEVPRVVCGEKAEGIGAIRISADDGKISFETFKWQNSVSAKELLGLDGSVARAVEKADESINKKLDDVFAKSSVDLVVSDPDTILENGYPLRLIRVTETNLGNLCADSVRSLLNCDAAVINGGNIRAQISAGDIKYSDILRVFPYGNGICLLEVTGQQILDALEWGYRDVPVENGGFLQVSGLSCELDTSVKSSCTEDENHFFTGVKGEYRVKNVKIGGKPLDKSKLYTLGGCSYILQELGDGFTMFADAKLLQNESMVDYQLLMKYISENLDGVIGPEYAEPYGEGRIVAK